MAWKLIEVPDDTPDSFDETDIEGILVSLEASANKIDPIFPSDTPFARLHAMVMRNTVTKEGKSMFDSP